MTTNTNTRGSEWRRWDLHVHTPESGMNNKYGNNDETTWDNFVVALFTKAIDNEIAAIGITDYFTIDGYKKIKIDYLENQSKLESLFAIRNEGNIILKEQFKQYDSYEALQKKIKSIRLFPNIEFRLGTTIVKSSKEGKSEGEASRVNYHVIFSDKVSIKDIEENFLHEIDFMYENLPFDRQNTRRLKKSNIEELGRKIKTEQPGFGGSDFETGCKTAVVQNTQIKDILLSHKDLFEGNYLIVIPVDEDLSQIPWKSQGHMVRKPFYQEANAFFSSNKNTINFGLGKKCDGVKEFVSEFKSLKPCIHGSDAHSIDELFMPDQNRYCWIKADPTFEGLKQILYEPESRVKIQETNPALDFDKSPFTEIVINKNVHVFSGEEDDGLQFSRSEIPLNDNLISIIGGRGTGKSKLVDYLANGLGKNTNSSYTRSDDIVIKRKKTLSESEYDLKLSDDNNLIFLYIRQSEIKGIVDDSTTLSKKIREIIGITEDFQIPADFLNDISNVVSNYRNTHNLLYSNGDYQEKRHQLDLEIKKYKDFITNITSEENRAKLETYKKNLEEHNKLINLKNATNKLISTLETSESDINKIINDINSEMPDDYSAVKISSISYQTTLNQINNVIKRIELDIQGKELEIRQTKDSFSDYKGDLASLLDNVQNFQNKILELETQKQEISKQEELLKNLEASLPQFGKKIQGDIELYKKKIESKWKLFIAGKENYTDEQKSLLEKILNRTKDKLDSQEQIDLTVEVLFDKDKMYKTILEGLDGRSWNEEKLEEIMAINSLESYYGYVTNSIPKEGFKKYNKWDSAINRSLDIFTRYNEFISHKIIIKSNNKPLNKLSAGQQGTTYLRLQLAANLFFTTIIYDQPEDDLDNNFITNSLVDLFKEIKKYRQVIIVSHNANLVVNSDSEQVIVAKNDGGILSYMSGALENPEINRSVCEILEGGEEAFQKREQKYNL